MPPTLGSVAAVVVDIVVLYQLVEVPPLSPLLARRDGNRGHLAQARDCPRENCSSRWDLRQIGS